jgi:hypothetical protein
LGLTHPTFKEKKGYKQKWINHLDMMPNGRIPKQVVKYKPTG